jgi:hypothetical protein
MLTTKKMSLAKICFDEAGNTGDNLLDSSQPIYCLLSTNISDTQSAELLSIIDTKAVELHFKNLKKRAQHQQQILQVINPLRKK